LSGGLRSSSFGRPETSARRGRRYVNFNRSPDVFISLQLPPPCSRSVCLQYLLRHRHLQNVFELALSQRPSECAPRLPEASAAGSEQLQSIDAERLVTHNTSFVAGPCFLRRHQDTPYKKMRPFDHLFLRYQPASTPSLPLCKKTFYQIVIQYSEHKNLMISAGLQSRSALLPDSPTVSIWPP
jgi:hypothetical protein